MTQTTPTSTPDRSLAAARPDLIHPFQCRPGQEYECSHYWPWIGGQVRCGMRENDPIHKNGPHMLRAKDGEISYCTGRPGSCSACAMEVLHPGVRGEGAFRV